MDEQRVKSDTINEELARKAEEIEVLRQASLGINTMLDPDEINDIVLHTMDKLFDFHHSIILLAEDSGNCTPSEQSGHFPPFN